MEKIPAGEELGREVARQGRSGGEGAASEDVATGGALVEAEGAEEIRHGTGAAAGVLTRERVRELSQRLDGLIEEGRRRAVELGGACGLVAAGVMMMIGLSGEGDAYVWLAPPAGLALAGIPWAAWWRRLRKLLPRASGTTPSLDQELGALRERFDAFMPFPGAISSTMLKFVAGMAVLGGAFGIVAGVGLWSVDEVSFAIGTTVGGTAFALTALPIYRFGKHLDRVGALGKEISAISRQRDRSLGSGGSVALSERLALENELDELRAERKKWLQAAAAAAAGSVAYPFVLGDVGSFGDLIGHVVFAVVFVVLLLIPVVRKQSHIRKLEARLDGLDEEDGSGVPRAPVERRSAAAVGPTPDARGVES